MKAKKVISILILILFCACVITCIIFSFSVKSVNGIFTTTENIDCSSVQQKLDKYSGVNLLFFTPEEMIKDIESDPYLQVIDVKKQFPNQLEVSIKERREVYLFEHNRTTYIADESGFVLNELSLDRQSSQKFNIRDFISLEFSDNEVLDVNIGEYIKTKHPQVVDTAFKIAKTARLTDCVKTMRVEVGVELNEVVFQTYTGVDIKISNIDFKGQQKATKSMEIFDSLTDYQKTFDTIYVNHYIVDGSTEDGVEYKSGDVFVVWSGVNS